MTARIPRPLYVVLLVALAGCATTHAVPSAVSSAVPSRPAPAASVPPPSAVASESGPSAAAKMICGSETNGHIATLTGLSGPLPTTSTWSTGLYTCTYKVGTAALVLTVQDGADPASARSYFDGLASKLQPTQTLQGLASLGLPAFKTSTGIVVFLKDSDVLTVDATQLPAEVGSQGETRDNLAYTVATDILACWSGK